MKAKVAKVYNRETEGIGYTILVKVSSGKAYNKTVMDKVTKRPYYTKSKSEANRYCGQINEHLSEIPKLIKKPRKFARMKNGEIYPKPIIGMKSFYVLYVGLWAIVFTLLALGFEWAIFGVLILIIGTFIIFFL